MTLRWITSLSFWALLVGGAALWAYDVWDRLRTSDNPSRIWLVLLVSTAAGAALELAFLLVRRWKLSTLTRKAIQQDPQAMQPDEQTLSRAVQWGNSFGNWTGAVLVIIGAGLSVAAYVLDWIDDLSPIAFFVGFALVWFAVGGHRSEPRASD